MKYHFLMLMLCVSGNALACRTPQWNTEKYYNEADNVFVGYISRMSALDYESAAIKNIFNRPYSDEWARFSNFKYTTPLLTGQVTRYAVQVIPFAPFKTNQPLPETIQLTIVGGCSNNDIPEVDSIGLFYINSSETAFIQQNNLNYKQQIATVKHLSHFVEPKRTRQ